MPRLLWGIGEEAILHFRGCAAQFHKLDRPQKTAAPHASRPQRLRLGLLLKSLLWVCWCLKAHGDMEGLLESPLRSNRQMVNHWKIELAHKCCTCLFLWVVLFPSSFGALPVGFGGLGFTPLFLKPAFVVGRVGSWPTPSRLRTICWVAVQELGLDYHNSDILLII